MWYSGIWGESNSKKLWAIYYSEVLGSTNFIVWKRSHSSQQMFFRILYMLLYWLLIATNIIGIEMLSHRGKIEEIREPCSLGSSIPLLVYLTIITLLSVQIRFAVHYCKQEKPPACQHCRYVTHNFSPRFSTLSWEMRLSPSLFLNALLSEASHFCRTYPVQGTFLCLLTIRLSRS
jgi:hypothetical protein